MPDRVIDSARLRELAEWCEEATNVKHYTVLQKALYADLARVLRAVLKAEAWLSGGDRSVIVTEEESVCYNHDNDETLEGPTLLAALEALPEPEP